MFAISRKRYAYQLYSIFHTIFIFDAVVPHGFIRIIYWMFLVMLLTIDFYANILRRYIAIFISKCDWSFCINKLIVKNIKSMLLKISFCLFNIPLYALYIATSSLYVSLIQYPSCSHMRPAYFFIHLRMMESPVFGSLIANNHLLYAFDTSLFGTSRPMTHYYST